MLRDSLSGRVGRTSPAPEAGTRKRWTGRTLGSLDLTMMQRAIRFGRANARHFDLAANNPYRFAFADWRFDANGFPLAN
jgi:hypothetical protein